MNTLNDMTPEQLRDLAKRASATADTKEQAARKAEKDIIPPPGTFWRYNDRVWTVVGNFRRSDVLISADAKTGGNLRGWWIPSNNTRKFSDDPYHKDFGWELYDREEWRSVVGELVLRRNRIH